MDLYARARAFLIAGGHTVTAERPGFLATVDSAGERALLWVETEVLPASSALTDDERRARAAREAALVETFRRDAGGVGGTLLVPSLTGWSQGFRADAKAALGVGVRAPIEFFDADYRAEGSAGRRRRDALSRILVRGRKIRRVPQPYVRRTGLGAADTAPGGADLVLDLARDLRAPGGARVWLLDGPAGAGKTVAFNALVLALHDGFQSAKHGRGEHGRPIAFNEVHLRGTGPDPDARARVDDLVAALIDTELGRPVPPAQLEWLLVHGFAVWLFDGLDEIYAGDDSFFPALERLLDTPGSQARVIVCTRDSLLSTSASVRAFVQRRLGRGLDIVQLAPWTEESWRGAAWIALEQERPGREQSATVEAFLGTIRQSAALRELAALPFYCAQLLGLPPGKLDDEFDVLAVVVDRMLDRERDKEIFAWSDFVEHPDLPFYGEIPEADRRALADALEVAGRERVVELLELVAHYRQRTDPRDPERVPVAFLTEALGWAHGSLDPRSAQGEDALLAMVQFAFFGMGEAEGAVDFSHPILADYLAGRYAARRIREGAGEAAVREALGSLSGAPPSQAFLRYLKREVARDGALRAVLERVISAGRLPESVLAFARLLLPVH